MSSTRKPLPPEEQLREDAYNLRRRFSDVLQLIEAKQGATFDVNHCVDYQGPIMFLEDSLEKFEGFIVELNGFIDQSGENEEDDAPNNADVSEGRLKATKLLKADQLPNDRKLEYVIKHGTSSMKDLLRTTLDVCYEATPSAAGKAPKKPAGKKARSIA